MASLISFVTREPSRGIALIGVGLVLSMVGRIVL